MTGRQGEVFSRDVDVRDAVPGGAEGHTGNATGSPVTVEVLPGTKAGVFGSGSGEPYARALRRGGGSLTLRAESGEPGAASGAGVVQFDVLEWCAEASALELRLLQGLKGPVLDIGCGPGRMLSAARSLGLGALGLDTSAEAVTLARDRGVRALHQSVFCGVPQSGLWQSVLLLDGNIGIGGNIAQLLGRCRQLVAPRGTLLVEADPDVDVDAAYLAVLEDGGGYRSEPFPWARTGRRGLAARASAAGWMVASTRRAQGRVFCWLSPVPGPVRAERSQA
ncbi:class I SAM-dependent methyltransferase [Arthrobacter sp. UYCu712]|uniref:class I SAM-dependent methyltransferase n=1 Tax=Arthrobacter sp. UYCu712 TaxID=3156340 RepID=UPI0033994853